MKPCAARPRSTPRCGVLSRTHIYVRYGRSLRPCLAAPIAPDRRSVILNRVHRYGAPSLLPEASVAGKSARMGGGCAPASSPVRRPTGSGYALRMADEKIRLGGMALPNGVLVHGPHAWACAIRTPDGELKVASAYKRFRAAEVERPLLRGPARLLEIFTLLPQARRALPEARLPFERPAVLASMAATAVIVRAVRASRRLGPAAQELVSG